MEMELGNMVMGVVTTILGGGAGWCLRATRRKAAAEASITELTINKNALLQINDLQQDIREKTKAMRELNNEVMDLTRRLSRLETEYEKNRCTKPNCPARVG